MKFKKNKIILGSANFNQNYGIKRNFIKTKEIKKLLRTAFKNKIITIDTSPLYAKSEKIIGQLNKNRFEIISKIPKKPTNIRGKNIKYWLAKNTKTSLENLKIKKFECLLLQNASTLLSRDGNEIYKSINSLKTKKLTKKIGISIYDFNILDKILKKFKFDLIQVPLNILDRRLLETKWIKKLKKKKIEVHVRSVFLQGILFLKHDHLPKKIKKLSSYWIVWENWLKKNQLSPLQACLSFIFNQPNLDGIVVGCDNVNQLNQILESKKQKNNFILPNLNIRNKKLIDPREWAS